MSDSSGGGGTKGVTYSVVALDADRAEGNAGTTPFTFEVRRTGSLAEAATILASVTNVSSGGGGAPFAADGADFAGGVLPSRSVTFAAGQASATIAFDVAGDTAIEFEEPFFVRLTTTTGGALAGTTEAPGVIRNDDDGTVVLPPSYTLTALDADNPEGNSGDTPFTFQVTRTGDASAAVTLRAVVTDRGDGPPVPGGTFPDGSDFVGGVLPSSDVRFAAGKTVATFTIEVAGDTVQEVEEYFFVRLTGPSGEILSGTTVASAVIRNDDDPVSARTSYTIAALDADKAEGDAGETILSFRLTRSGDLSAAVSVLATVSESDGMGTFFLFPADGQDFVGGALPSQVVTFAAGEAEAILALAVAGDTLSEPDESFFVRITGTGGRRCPAPPSPPARSATTMASPRCNPSLPLRRRAATSPKGTQARRPSPSASPSTAPARSSSGRRAPPGPSRAPIPRISPAASALPARSPSIWSPAAPSSRSWSWATPRSSRTRASR